MTTCSLIPEIELFVTLRSGDDESQSVALEPILERCLHRLQLTIHSDGRTRLRKIDPAVVDDKALELGQHRRVLRSLGHRVQSDGKQTRRTPTADNHHVEASLAVWNAAP